MSSKLAKKQFAVPRPPTSLVSRQKTQKQTKLTAKDKTTKSASLLKKSDAKLLKKNNNNKVSKEVSCAELAEKKEYYPNKLKRNMTAKKIVLKPKHVTKVVAGTNKRKMGTPHKDISSLENSEELISSKYKSELSIYDAVRLADDSCSLTDEDLMEILTCPSPVWWEDPPDAEYVEDAIFRLPDEKTTKDKHLDSQLHTQTSCDRSLDSPRHTPPSSDSQPRTQTSPDSHVDFEQEISHFRIKTDKFIQKKKKLENLLDNIINKTNKEGIRRLSESTEEDIFSDLSLNEEEILQHLENLDIPIEGSGRVENAAVVENPLEISIEHSRNTNETLDSKLNDSECVEIITNDLNENINEINRRIEKNGLKSSGNQHKSRIIIRKPNKSIKGCENERNSARINTQGSLVDINCEEVTQNTCIESIIDQNVCEISKGVRKNKQNMELTGFIKVRSDLIKSEFDVEVPNELPPLKRKPVPRSDKNMDSSDIVDSISDANIRFISDDDSIDEIFTDKNDMEINLNEIAGKNEFPKKIINDITEYITVYKIMSNDDKKNLDIDTAEVPKKNDNVVELNNFFKKCKGNKRFKKETVTVDGDIKKSGNSDVRNCDEQNRLKGCDYCIAKAERGDTKFSCDTCKMARVFSCDLCSFRSSAKEVIINHVSRCNKYNRTVVMC